MASANTIECANPEGCEAAIARTTFNGAEAYRLTDGRSEAIVVPAYGRVVSYGLRGSRNWLWTNSRKSFGAAEWKNWGGDKAWPAPQSEWPRWNGAAWPPDPAWDGDKFKAEVQSGGALRLTGPVSTKTGTQLVREFSFDVKSGDLVIRQTVRKLRGEPVRLSIWSVTQIEAPDIVFLPLGSNSSYPNGFQWIRVGGSSAPAPTSAAEVGAAGLLAVTPTTEAPLKIGVDGPVAALAAVKDRQAFVQRAARPAGEYPDGVDGKGFPVELFDNGQSKTHYLELELLSPLLEFKRGGRWTHTVRWSVHALPSEDTHDPAVLGQIKGLLERK